MAPVFIASAELYEPITRYPSAPLAEMFLTAARRALDSAQLLPHQIDAVWLGAAGHFPPEGFIGTLPAQLAEQLSLDQALLAPMQVGTSETGAWTLLQAYRWMRALHTTETRRVLVVTGEQMDPVASTQAWRDRQWADAQRLERSRALSRIVGQPEQDFGLSMLRVGDLLMDLWSHHHGVSHDECRSTLLPALAQAKYGRARGYSAAQFHDREPPSLAEYQAMPLLTPYFNLHDATPTSSGAASLVLTTKPTDLAIEIAGMGQARASLSLCNRAGDPARPQHVRQALVNACSEAQLELADVSTSDFAQLHDAFPSIELLFLDALELSTEQARQRLLSGWSNPLGGLKAGGHALGASGLFQVVQAVHLWSGNQRYLTAAAPNHAKAQRVFTTSVGGALTHVVATCLCAAESRRTGASTPAAPLEDPDYHDRAQSIPPGQGRVLARTQLLDSGEGVHPTAAPAEWVLWVQKCGGQEGNAKAFVRAREPIDIGALVPLPDA